jgi:hypothetical protein
MKAGKPVFILLRLNWQVSSGFFYPASNYPVNKA